MKRIKKLEGMEVYQKRSGRYAVKNTSSRQWLKAEDKIKVLLEQKLIKLTPPKPKAESAPAETTPAETAPTG